MASDPDPQVAKWFGEGSMARAQGHFSRLNKALSSDRGGFSINVVTGHEPTEGHAVAQYGHEHAAPSSATTPASIKGYTEKHAKELRQPGKVLGGWRNTDPADKRDYLDVSQVYPEHEAGRKQATLGSMVNNQKAFYTISKEQETQNPSYEGDKGAQARRLQRMSGRNVTAPPPKLPPLT